MFPLLAALLAAIQPVQHVISHIDLSPAFGAPRGWIFQATQAPDNPAMEAGNTAGAIHLCIRRERERACIPDLTHFMDREGGPDGDSEPHFLLEARVVRQPSGRAMLLIRAGSLYGGTGDQRIGVAAVTYDRARCSFALAYGYRIGRHMNQEIRYIRAGPLRGAIVSAEPAFDAPYGYRIIVNRLALSGLYQQVLRYRGATRYGDNNPLAVIDSEMPNLLQHLGLWHPGRPLPLPVRGCARPHMVGQELWC